MKFQGYLQAVDKCRNCMSQQPVLMRKSAKNVSKKQLPNTGTTETNTGLAGLGLGILGVLLAAARRRKEKNKN